MRRGGVSGAGGKENGCLEERSGRRVDGKEEG